MEVARLGETGKETGDRELIRVDTLLTGAGRFPELIYVPVGEKGEEEKPPEPILWEPSAGHAASTGSMLPALFISEPRNTEKMGLTP